MIKSMNDRVINAYSMTTRRLSEFALSLPKRHVIEALSRRIEDNTYHPKHVNNGSSKRFTMSDLYNRTMFRIGTITPQKFMRCLLGEQEWELLREGMRRRTEQQKDAVRKRIDEELPKYYLMPLNRTTA